MSAAEAVETWPCPIDCGDDPAPDLVAYRAHLLTHTGEQFAKTITHLERQRDEAITAKRIAEVRLERAVDAQVQLRRDLVAARWDLNNARRGVPDVGV